LVILCVFAGELCQELRDSKLANGGFIRMHASSWRPCDEAWFNHSLRVSRLGSIVRADVVERMQIRANEPNTAGMAVISSDGSGKT
jgi:hypothetical protein